MDGAGVGVTLQVTNYVLTTKLTPFFLLNSVLLDPNTTQVLSYVLLNKGSGNYMDLASNHLLCVPTMCQALTLPGMLVF